MRKNIIKGAMTLALVLSAGFGFAQTTYTWNTASGAYGTAANWTPARSAPAANDVLAFTSTSEVTALATDTIGKIIIGPGAAVTFNGTSGAAATVTLTGGANCLDIPATASLKLTGGAGATGAIIIALNASSTATIGGDFIFNATGAATPHRLDAGAAGAIVFASGSTAAMAPTTTGAANGFGNTTASVADGVVFQSGSAYYQGGLKDGTRTGGTGSNPFARTAPASNVVFQSGSSYVVFASAISTSGRTFANLVWRDGFGATRDLAGAGAFTVNGDVTITAPGGTLPAGSPAPGIVTYSMTGATIFNGNFSILTGGAPFRDIAAVAAANTINFKGNLTIASPTQFQSSTNANRTYGFSGTSQQTINVNGALFNKVDVNNAAGVLLTSPLTISTAITTTLGSITTSGNGGLILGTGVTAPVGYTGPVGSYVTYDATQLTAVSAQGVTFTPTVAGTGAAGTFGVLQVATQPTGLPTGIGGQRIWNINTTVAAGYTGDLTISYSNSDITGITEAGLKLARYNGTAWVDVPATVNEAGNTITATGVTAFSPWTVYGPVSEVSDWTMY